MADPDLQWTLREQRAISRRGASWLITFGVTLLAASVLLGRLPVELQLGGVATVGLVSVETVHTARATIYYNTWVDFTTTEGTAVRFLASHGTKGSGLDAARIHVRYLPGHPSSASIDRGLRSWLPALLFMTLLGVLLLVSGLRALRSRA